MRYAEVMAVLVEKWGGDDIGHCGQVAEGAVANGDGFEVYG